MPTECLLPDLGENIETGTVVEVLVAVGDTIAVDQPILILETDKAEFELPSSVAGTVSDIRVAAGDDVRIGQVLLVVADGAVPAPAAPAPEAAADTVASPPAAAAAAPARERVQPASSAAAPVAEVPRAVSAPPVADDPKSVKPVPAAPAVRRLARELGVDLHRVRGTGPHGRISKEDVQAYTHEAMTQGTHGAPAPTGGPAPDGTRWGPVERVPLNKVRARTAENLTRSWTVPHVTQMDKADVTDLEALRKRHAPKAEAVGGKLTVTAILTKVAAAALRKFPTFNASLDLERNEVVYKQYVHIGIAVDTERGLLVPVVRDADTKNILTLAAEIQDLANKARKRNIRPDMMQGATFTITNLGGIGGTAFTPILNAPEVAILGVSRGALEPVYRDGGFEPRLMLPLSLSYDHRLINGADAARFLRWICEALEQPFLLALEGP